ncbi:MAG: hypothetical protein K2F79_08205, partial [Muribaculaceae bacterium]|nr:hypothetical protein [Muribaculaceae bacterium]
MWASLTAHPQVLTETFDGIPDDLSWHIRVHTAKTKSTELTVYWNYADSADNTRAIFRTIPRSQTDDRLGGEVTYSIMRSDSVLSGGRFMSDYALASDCGFSVVLGYSSRGARLQAGGRGSEMAVEVPYSQEGKQTVGYTT